MIIKRITNVRCGVKGERITESRIVEFKCDRCVEVFNEFSPEFYNMFHWEDIAGYGSRFGDGVKLSLTLCESCLNDIAGKYIVRSDE